MAEHSRQKENTWTKASGGNKPHRTKLGCERSRKPATVAGLEGAERVAWGAYGEVLVFNPPLWGMGVGAGDFGLCEADGSRDGESRQIWRGHQQNLLMA